MALTAVQTIGRYQRHCMSITGSTLAICSLSALRKLVGREAAVTCGVIGLGFAMFENILYSLTTSVQLIDLIWGGFIVYGLRSKMILQRSIAPTGC